MAQDKAQVETLAEVQQFGSYHLVTYGNYQLTVDNAGMIKLPALVRPQDIDEFVGAMLAAQPIGLTQQANNQHAQEQMSAFFTEQRRRAEEQERQAALAPAVEKQPQEETPRELNRRQARAEHVRKVGGPRGGRKVTPEPRKTTAAVKDPTRAVAKAKAQAKAPAKKTPAKKAAPRKTAAKKRG